MIAFFTAVNHNYDDNQRTLQIKWIEMYQLQPRDVTKWTSEFPKTSTKMVDGSEKV